MSRTFAPRWAVLLLSAASLCLADPNADTTAACKALEAEYPEQVADSIVELSNLPIGIIYTETLTDYWSLANADNKPACMFFPKTAEEIQFAVVTLNKYPTAPWGIKGGGHNPNVGYSSSRDGVLIATHPYMATATLDENNYARVGPGCKWIDVAEALDPHNRAVVSGRLGVVGAAGLTLGGGLSFLSTEYGMTADNVVEYQVVTATGELTRANRDRNSDLFYALKGGGNQFAIVTEFVMNTYPIGDVWGGVKIYTMDQKDALLQATHNLVSDYYDPKAAVIVTYTSTVESLIEVFVVFYFYNSPSGPGKILEEFNSIPALISRTKTRSYLDLLDSNSIFSIPGMRYLIRTGTLPNLPGAQGLDLYTYTFDSYFNGSRSAQFSELDNYAFSLSFQPIPTTLANASLNNPHGVNLLGLDPAHGDKVFMEYNVSWLLSSTDEDAAAILTNLTEPAQVYARGMYPNVAPTHYVEGDLETVGYRPLFMNDAMFNQNPLRSYGDETFARLKEIQKFRDPEGFLARRQGGFKLE